MAENHVYTLEEIRKGLTRHFGFTDFKSNEQAEAVLSILNGKNDVILNMAPKAGKSIAFQLPLLMQDNNKLVVIITPLIALIYNHIRILIRRNINAETIIITTGSTDRHDIRSKLEENNIKFLYITPEIVLEMLVKDGFELLKKLVDSQKVSYFVLDEAQSMFQNDYYFQPVFIQIINELRREFKKIKWIAASTYVPTDVEQRIGQTLQLQNPTVIRQTHSLEQLRSVQHTIHENEPEPFDTLVQIIHSYNGINKNLTVSGIIFCLQWDTAENLFQALNQEFPEQILCYTGNTRSDNREEILTNWFNGIVPLIITTRSSFGLGIDKENIGFVIFWDIPKSPMDYFMQYARITSTKVRACHMFYEDAEYECLQYLLQKNVDLQNLDRIKQYGTGTISIEELLQSYIDRPYFQPVDE